jgi:hypothetical protein
MDQINPTLGVGPLFRRAVSPDKHRPHAQHSAMLIRRYCIDRRASVRGEIRRGARRLADCAAIEGQGREMKDGEYRYALAVREGDDLQLVLSVRRNPKGEFFVLVPHPDGKWDAHLSYHRSGKLHIKTHGGRPTPAVQRQSLRGQFRGTEHLGKFNVKVVGVICDSSKFTKVMEVPADELASRDSFVAVDLVAPGGRPMPEEELLGKIVREKVFDDTDPQIAIRIGTQPPLGKP